MDRVTRHKSCVACIQTKRKCDRTQPRCQRCITTGSACQYIGRTRARPQQIAEQSITRTAVDWQLQAFEVDHVSSATLLAPITNEVSFDILQQPLNLPLNESLPLITNIGDLVTHLQPPFIDPDSKLYARVEYCAARLSLIPNLFATTGQTMFIHRQSFQVMPSPVLQQAMSACALYCIKTPSTKPVVHQVLQHNVQHLLATTNLTSATNAELLAGLQALLLYQLMRLFDGDIRLRASAEADESATVLWASELRTRACAISMPRHPVSTFSNDSNEWQLWLFSESIRRTVVTTFLLQGVYNYLKTGTDRPSVVGVYFTMQEGLWNAQSEAGWTRAKTQKLELQVLVSDWDEVMALASPSDLEELGVLVMSMLWGLKGTQNWLGYDVSVRFGLETAIC